MPRPIIRRLGRWLLALMALAIAWMALASYLVARGARGRTWADAAAIPERRVGLVLGCSRVLADGRRNLFFENRMAAAAQLFRAGKVHYLIVSGDNHTKSYDEPRDMKNALVEAGVPAARIFCDYAGFRTNDSVARAREVFGQRALTIISQEFHNQRAIYIASHSGMDAIGFNAPEVDAYNSFRTKLREQVARANMMADLYVLRRQPRVSGSQSQTAGRRLMALRRRRACRFGPVRERRAARIHPRPSTTPQRLRDGQWRPAFGRTV